MLSRDVYCLLHENIVVVDLEGEFLSHAHNLAHPTNSITNTIIMIKLIVLFTGESCAGKDFTASVCKFVFSTHSGRDLKVKVASISDAFKPRYADRTGADLSRLLNDRLYKESHRPALTEFFKEEQRHRPSLHEETFLEEMTAAADSDVLLITGMREEAPVAAYAHLVPNTKLVEVYIEASDKIRNARKEGLQSDEGSARLSNGSFKEHGKSGGGLSFHNDSPGKDAAARFCEQQLLHLADRDVQ
jgi:hypothetical protein